MAKKRVSDETIAARVAFDVSMKEKFAARRILTRMDLEEAKNFIGFNWRRLAFWAKATQKQFFRECMDLMRFNGVLGQGKAKLSRRHHFA